MIATTPQSDLHSPAELLVAAHMLVDAGDVQLLRPAVLEAMTCLESYVKDVVFKALNSKLDALLVKWLEDKTRMDFDTRLQLLTPIATGHPITTQSNLWEHYKKAREIRNKVAHTGKRISREDASFVLHCVEDWLAYLVSSVGIELSLRRLKHHVESQQLRFQREEEVLALVCTYFSDKQSAASAFLTGEMIFGRSVGPDVTLIFGKYKIAVFAKLRGAKTIMSWLKKERQSNGSMPAITGCIELPSAFTHCVTLFFVRDGGIHGFPDVQWDENHQVGNTIINC